MTPGLKDRCVYSDSAELTDKTCFKHLSFLHWNVNGLLTKLKDRELIQYISSFHFVCLVETFVDYLEPSMFSSHTVFCKPAVKLTGRSVFDQKRNCSACKRDQV